MTLTPALVVVVPNRRDWRRVTVERWYRIPVRTAPEPVAAEYLAFYLTRRVGPARWHVPAYAAVQRYQLLRRREVLPSEPTHPRADDWYYRVALGPLQQLPRPIPSRRLRRITFIPTTLEALLGASDVAELWQTDEAGAIVWSRFPDAARKATRRLAVEERHADEPAAAHDPVPKCPP